jgi:hypothetical protein
MIMPQPVVMRCTSVDTTHQGLFGDNAAKKEVARVMNVQSFMIDWVSLKLCAPNGHLLI